VQELGREVGAIGPGQGVVHGEPGEVLGIPERLEDRTFQGTGEIDLALESVIESDPDPVATAMSRLDHVYEHASLQRGDRERLLAPLDEQPVLHQLASMQIVSLHEVSEGSRGKASLDHAGRDQDLDPVFPVSRVEVGRIVILEVHLDHDSQEPTDLRHG
jgi:hypothetical protein